MLAGLKHIMRKNKLQNHVFSNNEIIIIIINKYETKTNYFTTYYLLIKL